MLYIKKNISENRDVYVLNVYYYFHNEWHYEHKNVTMSGYFEEEVQEAIKKIREICAITRQGQEACQKAFDGENSLIVTLKNGLNFYFDLIPIESNNYPIIDIDRYPNLTYFDKNGEAFTVEDW